ncbi:hypothetical protein RchiOBHm_Chr1g0348771 [Rosa chinensis]|uniref:Uncharacterized protein n=1 Tax=Rosa chinensis TaxID=74649 RepID=A0A2P6SFN1_ROSCH|nr:hypothetical protein RchiOBHm_Chr1g0348771 [Rosa chinensis]
MAAYFVTLTVCLGLWCGRIYLLDILSPSNGMAEYYLCNSFFWRSDIYKSSMEERRKLQIPCLELRLPRIVLFTELNLYINFNLFCFFF